MEKATVRPLRRKLRPNPTLVGIVAPVTTIPTAMALSGPELQCFLARSHLISMRDAVSMAIELPWHAVARAHMPTMWLGLHPHQERHLETPAITARGIADLTLDGYGPDPKLLDSRP